MKTKLFLLVLLAIAGPCLSCSGDDGPGIDDVYKPDPDEEKPPFREVKSRPNATSTAWNFYTAQTVDRLPGFTPSGEPSKSVYGGWKAGARAATGFFRVEKIDGRWWIIDPGGDLFIHKAVAVFNPGSSDRQKSALQTTYGSASSWARQETERIKSYGFNGAGCWSNVAELRALSAPPVYCVFLEPMAKLRARMISDGEDFSHAGWQGYERDVVMVFDPRFDTYVDNEMKKAEQYKNDKYLLGYFVDNELPWKDDALDRCLAYFPASHHNHVAAKAWLDARKGKDASLADVTDADRRAFTGYYFEAFIKKVAEALRRYDPNHLFLGTKFNQEDEELANPEIMRVAGQYADIISIDHYRSWQPDQAMMRDWVAWSGKPFMIVEFYVKGEDSGLPNNTGAGWNVQTQADRGYFYQNFTLELIKSKGCVGWHWFTYQDNDPQNMNTDPSNRDSNKGIVTWDFQPYRPLLDNMKELNDHVYQLTRFYDK
ncbi:MAG: hypothetical protein LBP56_08460 [Odoribacteraceae bacterium]|jgi:hypothetical protein|nr:hypothetical protein [Odoribacteraceae bacterium]